MIATIVCEGGQPRVHDVTFGGYAQSTTGAVADVLSIPPRWVDWCIPQPAPSWIAIAWRGDDDWLHTGARTALERLLHPGHTETYERAPLDWRSWNAYTAVLDDPHLSVAALTAKPGASGTRPQPQPRSSRPTAPSSRMVRHRPRCRC